MRTPDSSSHRPTPPTGLATQPSRRGSTWARRVGAVAIVAGLGLAGVFVVRSIDGGAATYRTADVDDPRASTPCTPAWRRSSRSTKPSIGFPSAGTVSSVDVAVGDVVAVGQQLATLDTLELERTLREKQEALAQAQLTRRPHRPRNRRPLIRRPLTRRPLTRRPHNRRPQPPARRAAPTVRHRRPTTARRPRRRERPALRRAAAVGRRLRRQAATRADRREAQAPRRRRRI